MYSLSSSSNVSLPYFILAVPMRKSLGEHFCMSSTFPVAFSYLMAPQWVNGEGYVDNSFTALGSSDHREVRLEL